MFRHGAINLSEKFVVNDKKLWKYAAKPFLAIDSITTQNIGMLLIKVFFSNHILGTLFSLKQNLFIYGTPKNLKFKVITCDQCIPYKEL